jgi:predicted alpha/beta hydrolase
VKFKRGEVLTVTDILFNINKTNKLFMKRFNGGEKFPPVLMIHGAIENGRIFYSKSNKGLAPFLADKGFDVFVADLRGHGNSIPLIDKHSAYGQFHHITEDIPAFIQKVFEVTNNEKISFCAHSWGGVLLNSFFARNPNFLKKVDKCVYFGSKRRVKGINKDKLIQVYFVWGVVCSLLTSFYGYLPAQKFNLGADNDTKGYLKECSKWVLNDSWIDLNDNFDYRNALKSITLPPILYIAAKNDPALGNPQDVMRFMEESGRKNAKYTVLSKENGNLHNYDHISMLTHQDCNKDHFVSVEKWLKEKK